MEVSFPFHLVRCISAISALLGVASATVFCPPQTLAFVSTLESQCPLSLSTELPAALEVAGEFLEGALSSDQSNTHTSILFYASWCPFSQSVRSTFDILSSMFPQIKHFTVEESSIMPVVFSRYGVHSLPSILIANQTSSTRYCGSKDLSLLIPFYKRTTGFDPLVDFTKHESSYLGSLKSLPWDGSLSEILRREPFLVFSLLFLFLKALLYSFPKMLACLREFWVSQCWRPNVGIIGETGLLLERIVHVIDIKRAWSRLRFCENARIWASSPTCLLG
eukprot:TRINITY_DN22764_c0_g1_i7.p1 TRINITY_DN22764_c0_g1~~TRINITY_DN22764_c0_g1_i7.p1  ORF type:complete len:278 (+),score=32.80 TRINITY_DN22764_c0_g1_i7:149-982(+)